MTDLKDDKGKPDFTLLPPEVFRLMLVPAIRAVWDEALAGRYMLALDLLALAHPEKTEVLDNESVRVCAYGNKKYAPNSWRTDLGKPSFRPRYMAALARHLRRASVGQWTDPESGLPHIAHAAVNLMFLQCDISKRNNE